MLKYPVECNFQTGSSEKTDYITKIFLASRYFSIYNQLNCVKTDSDCSTNPILKKRFRSQSEIADWRLL